MISLKRQEERRKAEEEQRKRIEEYIQFRMLKASNQGGYRCKFNEGESVDESDIHLTIKDVVDFVEKNPRLEKEFYGNDAVEVIWRKGRSEFCEEPLKELPLPEEDADELSAESFTEAVNKMVDGMASKASEAEYSFESGV